MQIEPQLLIACKRNDRSAQVTLYKLCYQFLMQVCLRYRKNQNDAAEMLNQGMLKILDNLNSYNEKVPFEYWAKRIMINTLIDDYRKHKKFKLLHQSVEPGKIRHIDHAQSLNNGALQLDADAILKIINTLPAERLEVFNLFAIDGYSHKEIAESIKININTSKWHVAEARKYLQKQIEMVLPQSSIKSNETVR